MKTDKYLTMITNDTFQHVPRWMSNVGLSKLDTRPKVEGTAAVAQPSCFLKMCLNIDGYQKMYVCFLNKLLIMLSPKKGRIYTKCKLKCKLHKLKHEVVILCLKSMFAVLGSHVEFLHGQSILQQSS